MTCASGDWHRLDGTSFDFFNELKKLGRETLKYAIMTDFVWMGIGSSYLNFEDVDYFFLNKKVGANDFAER